MAQKKTSAAVIAVAVMNLVLGVPCLICTPLGLVATQAMQGFGKQNNQAAAANNPFGQMEKQQKFMEQEAPGFKIMQYVGAAAGILFSLGLIASAILLFGGKPLGRTVCIAVCALFAVWTLINCGYQLGVAMPASKKFFDQEMQQMKGAPPPKGLFEVSSGIGIVFALLIGVGYPILATALLMTPGARKALSGGSASANGNPPEDNADDYDRPDGRFRPRDDFDDR